MYSTIMYLTTVLVAVGAVNQTASPSTELPIATTPVIPAPTPTFADFGLPLDLNTAEPPTLTDFGLPLDLSTRIPPTLTDFGPPLDLQTIEPPTLTDFGLPLDLKTLTSSASPALKTTSTTKHALYHFPPMNRVTLEPVFRATLAAREPSILTTAPPKPNESGQPFYCGPNQPKELYCDNSAGQAPKKSIASGRPNPLMYLSLLGLGTILLNLGRDGYDAVAGKEKEEAIAAPVDEEFVIVEEDEFEKTTQGTQKI